VYAGNVQAVSVVTAPVAMQVDGTGTVKQGLTFPLESVNASCFERKRRDMENIPIARICCNVAHCLNTVRIPFEQVGTVWIVDFWVLLQSAG
jgi:hypothetical protein